MIDSVGGFSLVAIVLIATPLISGLVDRTPSHSLSCFSLWGSPLAEGDWG